MSFYARDLARIHDEGYGDFARAAAAELMTRAAAPARVVELGCGSGISCAILAAAGFEVAGIDASADMLAIARERVPRATFVQASVWDAELPRCDAATAFGEILNYTNAGSGELAALAERVRDALAPGGLFLFDVATVGRGTGTAHREGDDWAVDADTLEDDRTLTRRIRFTVDGRESEETHVLRLYERGEVTRVLEDAGFTVEVLESYGDFAFWPGYAGFAATAPE